MRSGSFLFVLMTISNLSPCCSFDVTYFNSLLHDGHFFRSLSSIPIFLHAGQCPYLSSTIMMWSSMSLRSTSDHTLIYSIYRSCLNVVLIYLKHIPFLNLILPDGLMGISQKIIMYDFLHDADRSLFP